MFRLTILFIMIAAFVMGIPTAILGQDEETQDPWVYVSEFKVPAQRLDSLTTMLKKAKEYKWVETAKSMGFILDQWILIHHTGDEWTVRIENVYPSWSAVYNPGWQGKVSEAAYGDDLEVFTAAFTWIFAGVPHRDSIYRLVSRGVH